MIKYYTRACNFYYGNKAKTLIKKKLAFPLCGSSNIAFDNIEIFKRRGRRINKKLVHINTIKFLPKFLYKKVKIDLKKIISKRKNFLKNIDFSNTSVMGILNLTPDSFSDGGKYNSKNKSFAHISNLIKSGANIIDVGGESTRPGSKTVHPKTEWNRVKHVLKNFKKKYKHVCLSLDTRKSDLMAKGCELGVDLINDVSGFNFDQTSIQKLKHYNVAKVVHHMQGTPNTMQKNPKYNNVLLDVYDFLEHKINKEIGEKKIIIDPGIGFGKTLKHNLSLISNISLFHSLGFPILIGTSRKRFINQISKEYDTKERIGGTLGSILFLLSQGVQVFRVHNVAEVKQGIIVFKKILINK